MALATAPNGKRHLKPWERNPWDKKARQKAGNSPAEFRQSRTSLEDITNQSTPSPNGHDATDMVYALVLPDISASSTMPNGMTAAEWQNHLESVREFNARYNGKGIDNVVEKSHNGLFGKLAGKAYDATANAFGYAANATGMAVSLIPMPARRALLPAGLAVSLVGTGAACEFGSRAAHADVALASSNVTYNAERNLVSFIVVADYISSDKRPVEGVVSVYLDGSKEPLVSQKGVLNPEKGTDFIVQADLPPGSYNFRIQVDVPGINESDYGNNFKKVSFKATPIPDITATPQNTPIPTEVPATATAEATPKAKPTETPATVTPAITNSYDFGKSLGLDANYLKGVKFDDTAKEFVRYLSSVPSQMRGIAERSGLVKKLDDKQSAGLVDDGQINSDELGYFKRVMESYARDIENVRPWLNQISAEKSLEALALNLSNFREADKKGQLLVSLRGENVPALLSTAIFYADGVERKYASEIKFGDRWGGAVFTYASTMVDNITNFSSIHNKALEVANNPNANYFGHSIEDLLDAGYFEGEAVGSTDKGQNAYLDMKLLLEQGSPQAKAALRLYARNYTGDGNMGSAGQARVQLTETDLWSLGIPSYTVVLAGHDVPTIPVTLDDIALLKGRSSDSLFILEIDGRYNIPLQWTRKSIVKKEWKEFSLVRGTEAPPPTLKVSELKNY